MQIQSIYEEILKVEKQLASTTQEHQKVLMSQQQYTG